MCDVNYKVFIPEVFFWEYRGVRVFPIPQKKKNNFIEFSLYYLKGKAKKKISSYKIHFSICFHNALQLNEQKNISITLILFKVFIYSQNPYSQHGNLSKFPIY